MSESHREPDVAKNSRSKRRRWLHSRSRHKPLDKTKDNVENTTDSTLNAGRRPADVQPITPATPAYLESPMPPWSTQSCPSPAVHSFNIPIIPRPTAPKTEEAAPQLSTPNTVKATTKKTPRTTYDNDPTTAPTPISAMSSTSEEQLFTTLIEQGFFVPSSASLDTPSLILFKRDTPSLDRFRLLHNQLFIELGRVVEEQLQPSQDPESSVEAYRQKEVLMLGLLTEVMPALNHFTETVGKEVKSGIKKHCAGLRLWAGEVDGESA